MSKSQEIFIKSSRPIKELVDELSVLLDIKLVMDDTIDSFLGNSHGGKLLFALYEHEYDNDRSMNFESFKFCLSITATGFNDYEKKYDFQMTKSNRIYELLKATRKFDLLHTLDLQREISRDVI